MELLEKYTVVSIDTEFPGVYYVIRFFFFLIKYHFYIKFFKTKIKRRKKNLNSKKSSKMQINSKSYKLALLYPHLMASFLCKITVHGNLTLNLIKSIFLNFLKNSKICRIVKKYFSKNNNSKDIRAKGSI